MHFDRAPDPGRAPITPADRLVRRTSRGLALVTLSLIAALLASVGLVTAALAIDMTDQNVDRTLEQAAADQLATLESQDWHETEHESDGHDEDHEATPAPTASVTGPGVIDADDPHLESFQIFYLVLDDDGTLIANPQRISLTGLPDASAAQVAASGADDLRSVTAGGVHVRLLTKPVVSEHGQIVAVLQTGFVLTQHDQQTSTILFSILLVSLTGLLGAAVVTVLVTSRAMAPIRTAFTAERRFVAAASHELRTPVAVVRASAEILQRESLVKPGGERLVEDIVAESDRLGRLVGDLLALASAEAGAIDIKPQPIEMRAFVTELARRAETIAAPRGVKVEVVQNGSVPADQELFVEADPDRMAQLLLIFLDNAFDHSPAGSTVRLIVGPTTDANKAKVSIGVADEGPGVPRHERQRIFEPFARLAGRRRATGNTGLGLAIARVLAARQNGTLHVDDAAGGGAVFSVWLPRLAGAG